MLMTLIQKEIMHHILSVRFVALLLMCLSLIPLTLSINYRNYRQNLVDYQEAVKLANLEEKTVNPKMPLEPEIEVSKLFLKPTPMSVFANGLGDRAAKLSWDDPQRDYPRGSSFSLRFPRLSFRTSRLSFSCRHCF